MISGVQEYQELAVKYVNDPEMFQKIQDHYSTFFGSLKDDMGDLGMNVSELTGLFNSDMSTPWMETFNNLSSVSMENLLANTAALFSGDDGITAALTKVGENFANYSENEKGMSERLSGYIESTTNLNSNADTLTAKMKEASKSINDLVSNIGTLVSNLEGYAEKYTTWLEDAIGIEKDKSDAAAATEENTTATEENTTATGKLVVATEKLIQVIETTAHNSNNILSFATPAPESNPSNLAMPTTLPFGSEIAVQSTTRSSSYGIKGNSSSTLLQW
jgi:ABC-type transporter Mla subunit MlaD